MSDGAIPVGAMRRPMRSLRIAASGLSAQRTRLDVIAANIANAETTKGTDGTPYRRKVVSLEEVAFEPLLEDELEGWAAERAGRLERRERLDDFGETEPEGTEQYGGVRVAGVAEDLTEGALVYDPGHPDADENGYVRMPNVDISTEMVDLMESRRLFDANATVFQAIKAMLRRSTQL